MDKHLKDLIEVMTTQDGQYNETIGAYVTAYPVDEEHIVYELEYADEENEWEVIETVSFTINLTRD